MYKIKILKELFLFLSFCFLSILACSVCFRVNAQSADTLQFTINIDKPSIAAGDSFTIIYTIKNNAPDYSIYNAKIDFTYIDQLNNTDFTGSTTGLSKEVLKNSGYSISQLAPSKIFSFSLYFKTRQSIDTSKKIVSNLDSSNNIKSTITFNYSTDNNAPVVTKDAQQVLPDIVPAKPQVSTLSYPPGFKGYDLSKIDSTNVKMVSGFFLQGINKITFNEPIDLSTPEAISIIKNPSSIFDLNSINSITISNNNTFNKKASIELDNTSFIDTPILFSGTEKSLNPLTFDSKTKSVKFDISGIGKYTIIGQIKTTVPTDIQGKFISISGIVTDLTARVDIKYEEKSIEPAIISIDTGSFSASHEYPSYGVKNIEFDIYAINGVINKQIFPVNFILTTVLTTPIPTIPITSKTTTDYFSLIKYLLIGLLIFAFIIFGIIIYLSLKARKDLEKTVQFSQKLNKKQDLGLSINENTDNELIDQHITIASGKNSIVDDSTVSESRHEVIRAKVYKNLYESLDKNNISKEK